MVEIVKYGTYIIDVSTAMIEYRRGLAPHQIEVLQRMNQQASSFVTACFQHEKADLTTLYHFLDGKAVHHVKMITHHCEFLLRDRSLHAAYRDGLEQVLKCIDALIEELSQMKEELVTFMGKIGMKVPTNAQSIEKQLQPIAQSNLQFEYEEAPIPEPPLPVPHNPIKRLRPKPQQPVQVPVAEKRIKRLSPRPQQPVQKIRRLEPLPQR